MNEDVVRETAEAFVDHGLREAGYRYVVVDDFWEADERDSRGRLQAHPERFPNGMKALADHVHRLGLKFGIYTCAGTHTCGRRPGSYGFEEIDAQTFADWGVDFVKVDFCHKPLGVDGPTLYKRMGQALRQTGRPILFSACEWGTTEPWLWAHEAGCHMWRTTGDIVDSWESIAKIGFSQAGLERHAGPNRWNDPDMLVVGMHGKGNVGVAGCTDREYRFHFALWCLLAAPLMIGCDVRDMTPETKATLTNPGAIAVDQDPLEVPASRIGADWNQWDWENYQVWGRPLADGSVAVGLFNQSSDESPRLMTAPWEAFHIAPNRKCRVEDVWTGERLAETTVHHTMPVAPHDCAFIRIRPI
ncbi:MAG: glycoside hydrolase family 27 protein [Fimbriimonadaceae bacterium]